jgi:hypothetical protein
VKPAGLSSKSILIQSFVDVRGLIVDASPLTFAYEVQSL